MNVLECSSAGDKRFSAFYARVNLFGYVDSIENFYQNSKRKMTDEGYVQFDNPKGKKPDAIFVNGNYLEGKYSNLFYKLMWMIYLDNNPLYVEYLKQFDDFHDRFKGKHSLNCQADEIRQYVRQGQKSMLRDVEPLLDILGVHYMRIGSEYVLTRNRLYTVGYTVFGKNPDRLQKLVSLARSIDAVIVDVRLKPYSQWYADFNKKRLQDCGVPYLWMGDTLGNTNYKNGKPFILADEKLGLRLLENMLKNGKQNVLLMCAESDPRDCHRRYIARKLTDSRDITHFVKKGFTV